MDSHIFVDELICEVSGAHEGLPPTGLSQPYQQMKDVNGEP
jgi:hypothetical protein